jgi:anthranilate phosphoribosyltransferase
MTHNAETEAAFARFVATLGRGPGRSRALTREEAREAFGMVLAGQADPHQVGAFMMLLRFRGEDADEIAGMVEAGRSAACGGGADLHADLDWPSYGAGRTRGAPWFLLAALALARAGFRVVMHGSNDFSAGMTVTQGLAALGLSPCPDRMTAASALQTQRFAYLPLATLAPEIDRLLGLRRLFGLRSPVNTVARLLNPAEAPAGVDGVFHPPYIDVHLGVAERLGRQRLLVLKGGGGEAERVPLKAALAHLWDRDRAARVELALPAVTGLAPLSPPEDTPGLFAAVWQGAAAPPTVVATIEATIALGLLALGRAGTPGHADDAARAVWNDRKTLRLVSMRP